MGLPNLAYELDDGLVGRAITDLRGRLIQGGGEFSEAYRTCGHPTTLTLNPPVLVLGRNCPEVASTYPRHRIDSEISSRNAIPVRKQNFNATRLLLCPTAVLAALPVLADDDPPDGVKHFPRRRPSVQSRKAQEDVHILAWIDADIPAVGADQQRLDAPLLELLVLLNQLSDFRVSVFRALPLLPVDFNVGERLLKLGSAS